MYWTKQDIASAKLTVCFSIGVVVVVVGTYF